MATGFSFATAPNNGSIFGSKPAAPSSQPLSFGIGNATNGLGGALSGNTVGNTIQNSLFNTSNTNTVASLGAPSINTNKLSTTAGATITVATKFVELPEDFQKEIERIE